MGSNDAILTSLQENSDEVFLEISQTLIDIINNVLSEPNNLSFRTLNLSDTAFTKFLEVCGAVECLFHIGFVEDGDKLYFPTEQPLDHVRQFHAALIGRRKQIMESKQLVIQMKSDNQLLNDIKQKFNIALIYNNENLLEEAKQVIPLQELKSQALKSLEQSKASEESNDIQFSDCLLYELLKWFKNSFFKWVNAPECEHCKSATRFQTVSDLDGLRTEIFVCDICKHTTNFIRYQDPKILLKTRRGRCGEWANTFTLLCCSLGWDARIVYDCADHVWTEVYSGSKNRWVHCDACETALDTPLMYEVGWKKQLPYVFAFSPYEVQDVTWRYSKDFKATILRRTQCNEALLATNLVKMRHQRQINLPDSKKEYLELRIIAELVQMLEENKIKEGDEKERESGSIQWRIQRGEALAQSNVKEYKWMPIKSKKYLSVRYNIVNDVYEQIDKDGSVIQQVKGWQHGIFKSKDIFRKHEFDWNCVYLARLENTTHGNITWSFETADDSLVIEQIDIKFQSTTFENGKVSLRLMSEDDKVHMIPGVSTYSTKEFSGKKKVCLVAKLTGGRGDSAWQHAQLFRQSTNPEQQPVREYPFAITIKFKNLPKE